MPIEHRNAASSSSEADQLRQRLNVCEAALATAQREQRQSERRAAELETILQSLPEAVYVGTDEGITIANDSALDMVGFHSHDELNRDLTVLVDELEKRDADTGEPLSADETGFAHALEGRREVTHITIRHRDTGEDRVLRSSTAPVKVDGEIVGAIALHMDVTEQRRAEQEQRFLSDVTAELNAVLDSDGWFDRLGHIIVPELADLCVFHALTQEGVLETIALIHRDPACASQVYDDLERYPVDVDSQQPVAQALRTGKPVCYEKITDEHKQTMAINAEHLEHLRSSPMSSLLCVPLNARNRTLGTLTLLYDSSERRYTERNVALMEELAWRAALALDNANLFEREQVARYNAERVTDRIIRLQRTTAALAESLTFDDVAEMIVDQGISALGARAGSVVLLTPDKQELEIVQTHGYAPEITERGQRFPLDVPMPVVTTIREALPVWLGSPEEARVKYAQLPDIDSESAAWATLPLQEAGQTVGGIVLSFAEERSFTLEDQAFMLALTQQCSVALERARLYEVQQRARTTAEAAVRQRDQMFSLISHDMKTPLSSIQGYTYLLQQRLVKANLPDKERLMRGLSNIATTTTRVAGQVEELLDLATLQAGQTLSLHAQDIDVIPLVQRVVDACQHLSTWHTLRSETTEEHLVCTIDELRVERVLGNLMTNAIKYSPDGGDVRIQIRREWHNNKQWAAISVIDQGMGIPEDELPTIFDAFRRSSKSSSDVNGAGLGLASVQQIMRQHGGSITVESEEGVGSTFTIWLPIAAEERGDSA